MKDRDDLLRHSTATWFARVVAIALNSTRTGVPPVVAIGRAKTGLDLAFAIAVAS